MRYRREARIRHRVECNEQALRGDRIEGALDAALRELFEWRTPLMQALGYERDRKPKDK